MQHIQDYSRCKLHQMAKFFIEILFYDGKNIESQKYINIQTLGKLPEEVVVSPEDAVTMVKLQTTAYWGTINTCPTTQKKTDASMCSSSHNPPTGGTSPTLSSLGLRCCRSLPSVAVGGEDDCSIWGDVDDTVLCLDTHPTQLDVLRVCRAHLGVILRHDIQFNFME